MIHGSVVLANAGCIIAKVDKTTNFIERMRGLLGTAKLDVDRGLLITPCSSVHTFAMNYPIDVLFLDKQMTIVKATASLKPWRMAASSAASLVLELAENSIENLQLQPGQQLEWYDATST